jgi:hypothetical protein
VGLPFRVLTRRLALPSPPPGQRQPGPYALADPAECVAVLREAGFVDVSVTALELPFWVDSPDEYARYAYDILPVHVREMLREKLGSDDDPDLWQEVAELAGTYADARGRVVLTSTALFLRAVAPVAGGGTVRDEG